MLSRHTSLQSMVKQTLYKSLENNIYYSNENLNHFKILDC